MVPYLVSPAWVFDNLHNPDIKIIDASMHMTDTGRIGYKEYDEQHIENAVFFDIERIVDTKSPLPHMLPDDAHFSKAMSILGIGNEHHIVVYDNSPLHSGLRVWWMLREFGHENVSYMDGGLTKWVNEGYPLTTKRSSPVTTKFTATLQSAYIRDAMDIFDNITSKKEQVMDARASARFTAKVHEVRANLRSGHIPGSINVPFFSLFDTDGTMLDADELLEIFTEAGTDFDRPIITTCGSGITACVLLMALKLIGKDDVSVYDGSWSEWGGLSEDIAPIVTGSD
jgi:thiosulfate/3-mercaptopyruvate sulfurtransferase